MATTKKLVLVAVLVVIVTLGVLAVTTDHLPTPPLPDFLGIHWGRTEPLKTHSLNLVEDIDEQLEAADE